LKGTTQLSGDREEKASRDARGHATVTGSPSSEGPVGLALLEPDQPGNFGAALRLVACFGVRLEVVEPCGFPLDERRIRRAGMDYVDHAEWRRHADVEAFTRTMAGEGRRLILLSARAQTAYHRFAFDAGDVLAVGSESRGAPTAITERAVAVRIPMRPGLRSLNVVTAAAIGLAEAIRQLNGWPAATK
jgi:tRNA (cytidine/uridine-2'-O-)-methyltransferase